MNLPIEDNNFPLFKYSPELTSQFLIQTNQAQEFVEIPNISDDLLLTGLEDGTYTWTLNSLPILLNSQNDHDVDLQGLQPQKGILNEFLENNVENKFENSSEIVLPLELSENNLLTENGLFITNTAEDLSPPELISATFNNENILVNQNEIQSSDVSSQEAYIDVNGLIIPQQYNLNTQELIFNLQDLITTKEINFSVPNKVINMKRKVLQKFQLQNSNQDLLNNELFNIQPRGESSFLYDNSSVEICKSNQQIDVLKEIGLEIDNEPDSTTIFNDLNDTLNIDELATIVQTYQCKKCDFFCTKREEFFLHFKELHYVIPSKKNNIKSNDKRLQILKPPRTKTLNAQQVENTIQIIINENGELVSDSINCTTKINNSKINEEPVELAQLPVTNVFNTVIKPDENIDSFETNDNDQITELENENIETTELENENIVTTELENENIETTEFKNENIEVSNKAFEQVKIVLNDKEYTGLIYTQSEEKEKKIMRLKRKKKISLTEMKKTKPNSSELTDVNIDTNQELIEDSTLFCTTSNKDDQEKSTENPTDVSPIFLCATCSDQFSSVEECKIHYVEVHKYEDNLKEIDVTDKIEGIQEIALFDNEKRKELLEKFFQQDVLKKRKHKCQVKGCPYRFAKIDLLKRHESCHINGTRTPFCCPECKEQFNSWRICSVHLWKCHKVDIDFYTCPLCDYKGSTYDKLKHHVKIHSEDRDYICPDCGRDFKQPSQLRNHRVIHLDKTNMQNIPRWFVQKHCDMCGKLFSDAKCLKKHIQAVHSKLKPFICNVCGHSCARKAMLQLHLRQHTGDKPYSCSLCVYKTGDHNSLRRHTMRHTGDRPYKCPYCDYAAIQSNSYKNHLSAKHPEKNGFFKCNTCPFKTVNEEIYYSHLNDHSLGLLQNDKGKASDKSIKNNSTTDALNNNMKNTRQQNFKEKKHLEIEDDETQNCLFSSLGDITDEQTVDTGGITIPADPDDPESIIT